jgi:hypothetical protein
MKALLVAFACLAIPGSVLGKEERYADGLFQLPTVCGSLAAIQELYHPKTSPERQVELMNSQCRLIEPSTSYYLGERSGPYVLIEMYKLNGLMKPPRQSLGSWWILGAEVHHYALQKQR